MATGRAKAVTIASATLFAVVFAGMALSLVHHYTDPAYSKTRGWRELAAAMERVGEGGSPEQVRIAQNYPDPTLWYYYRGPIQHLVLPPVANDAAGARAAVEALANQGVTRVLLPIQPAGNWDNNGLGADALSGRYDRVAQLQVGVWPLQVYAAPAALTQLTTTFTNGVSLNGVAVMPTELTPGGVIAVHLDWRGNPAGLTGSEKVFVHLLDQDGQLVAQDDRPLRLTGPLAAGSGLAAYGVPLPAELASGNYRLVTGLYAPDVAGAPRIPVTGGADFVMLSELSVP
ncbi:MAG: hypothetical protein IPK16_09460 [Anaerolineales bacterium]|nr:hypothetical protein [Anaerolineales bacterium]